MRKSREKSCPEIQALLKVVVANPDPGSSSFAPGSRSSEAFVLALPGAILLSSPAGQFLIRSTVTGAQDALDPVNLLAVEKGSVGEMTALGLGSR